MGTVILIIKTLIITRALVRRLNKTVQFKEPFRIINQDDVRVRLSPPPCTGGERLVVMVSSGPDNARSRAHWREEMSGVSRDGRVKMIFLVSSCQPDQVCRHDLGE